MINCYERKVRDPVLKDLLDKNYQTTRNLHPLLMASSAKKSKTYFNVREIYFPIFRIFVFFFLFSLLLSYLVSFLASSILLYNPSFRFFLCPFFRSIQFPFFSSKLETSQKERKLLCSVENINTAQG